MRVFISYTTRDHRDRALARQIADGLGTREAVEVFFAPKTLRAGDTWKTQLHEELSTRCSHMVVIVSAASVTSNEVLAEIELGRKRAAADPAFCIIPLVMGNVANPLSDLHWIEYCEDGQEQVELIARALGLPPQTDYERAFAPVILSTGGSSGGGELVPRLCDRREQEHSFRSAFQLHLRKKARAPQVYFIHGGEGEKHESLVDRFRWTFMSKFAETVTRDRDASVSLNNVLWPLSDTLHEASEELLSELFGAFDPQYLTTPKEISAQAFVRLIQLRPEPVIAVQHTIRSTSWSRSSPQVLERYLHFWDEVAALGPSTQIVVFFNFVLCDADERNAEAVIAFLDGLAQTEEKPKPFWKKLKSFVGTPEAPRLPPPKNISLTPLPPLLPIRREDVDDWFDQRLQRCDYNERQRLCDELFRATSSRKMADVERRLTAFYNDYQFEGRG